MIKNIVYCNRDTKRQGGASRMKDEEIVSLFFYRDDDAIKILDDTYGKALTGISYRILYNEEDAKECVNDAYMNTWDSIPDARPESIFAYVGRIVRNLSINRLKKNEAKKRGGEDTTILLGELQDCITSNDSVEGEIELKELTRHISEFLHSIKQEQRMLFVERYWYAKAIKDIAKDYRMSARKVEAILYRLRNKLREYLAERGYFV